MSISENYTPQTENLTQLTKVLSELNEITQENTIIKDRIVNKIDELVKEIKTNGETDHSQLIQVLNVFLEQREIKEIDSQINNKNKKKKNKKNVKLDSKQELLQQNIRLKQVLKDKREYLSQVQQLGSEYEENIDVLLLRIEETKSKSNIKNLQIIRELRKNIELSEKEEFEMFLQLTEKQEVIYRLSEILKGFYKYV